MAKVLLLIAVIFGFLVPVAHAATLLSGQNVTISSSTPDNAYVFAEQSRIVAPLPADLCAIVGSLTVAAPITGDALLGGGTIDIQSPVAGDVRTIGGRVSVDDTVGGDLMAAGGVVNVLGKVKDAYIAGGTVDMLNGSNGPVTIYGADVSLAGEFNGDVEVVAADKITIQEGTVIHGVLKYNAPQQTYIPASATISGGVNYIGSAAWLPTVKQAKTFATAGFWIFILVRLTAVLVVTGLIAGVFPVFTDRVVEATLRRTPERLVLSILLGFAGFVVVPVLLLILTISFVGIGIALLLLSVYVLFLMLSYIYAAVLVGALCMRILRKHTRVSWQVALLGVVVLYLVGSLPYVGFVIRFIIMAAAGGALLTLSYTFAFKREAIDVESL
jgi:hypothetical protein